MDDDRVPAEVFPLASYLAEEMLARRWTSVDVAERMSDRREFTRRVFLVDLLLAVQDEKMAITDEILNELAQAFGVSTAMFRGLHEVWLKWSDRRVPFECPDEVLSGGVVTLQD